jgi:hypothetical protein
MQGPGPYGAQPPGGWGWAPPPPAPPQPGVIPLRPLSLGDVLGGAFSTMGRYWKQLFGTAAAAYGAALLVSGLALLIAFSAVGEDLEAVMDLLDYRDPAWEDLQPLVVALAVVLVVVVISVLVATAVVYAACPAVLQDAVLGRPTAFGAVWRRAWSRLPAVMGTVLLSGVIVALPPLLYILLVVGALAVIGVGDLESASAGTTFGLLFLGVLLTYPVSIWLWVRLCFGPAVAVFENQGPVGSLRRSARLVRGVWWRTFGITLLAYLIAMFASYMIQIPFTFIGMFASLPGAAAAGPDTEPAAMLAPVGVYLLFILIGSMIGQIVASILPQLVSSLLYVDQRIRRESLDLSLAQAAGMPLAPPPAAPPAW